MESNEPPGVPFIRRGEIEKQAMAVLRRHGICSLPVDPVLLANRAGIKVHNAQFAEEGLAGIVAKRGDSTTLLVNTADPPYRKRFTIAHELGHHFLHLLKDGEFVDTVRDLFRGSEADDEASVDADKRMQIQANVFAAALLMPESLVREAWEKTRSVEQLARIFNVSEEAMGIRLDVLGLG